MEGVVVLVLELFCHLREEEEKKLKETARGKREGGKQQLALKSLCFEAEGGWKEGRNIGNGWTSSLSPLPPSCVEEETDGCARECSYLLVPLHGNLKWNFGARSKKREIFYDAHMSLSHIAINSHKKIRPPASPRLNDGGGNGGPEQKMSFKKYCHCQPHQGRNDFESTFDRENESGRGEGFGWNSCLVWHT